MKTKHARGPVQRDLRRGHSGGSVNVSTAVQQAKAQRARAVARGVRNPAPFAQIRLVAKREIKTERFTLAKGEQWDVQFARFERSTAHVEIGNTLVPLPWVRIVGLTHTLED